MLTDCLTLALQEGLLNEDHWFFTDEQLARYLVEQNLTKEIIKRFAIGDVYNTIFIGRYSYQKREIDLREPNNREGLANALKAQIEIPCSPYIFYDYGTFYKDITINVINASGSITPKTLSTKSQSTIVSIFTSRRIDQV